MLEDIEQYYNDNELKLDFLITMMIKKRYKKCN